MSGYAPAACSEMPADGKVVVAEAHSSSAWNEYVSSHAKASVYHDWRWRDVIARAFDRDLHYLAARNAHATCGVLPLVRLRSLAFGDFLVSLPYFTYGGVLADTPEVARKLIAAAADLAVRLGVDHVELRHTEDHFPELPKRTDKVAMTLALPGDVDSLWRGFKTKLRAQIKRPAKEGATVVEGGADLVDAFYGVYARNMRDLGTPVFARRFATEIATAFAKECRIFVVKIGDECVGAALVLRDGPTVEVPWASTLREANRIGVNMLLYSRLLTWSVEQSCRVFDFGRSTPDSGTYRFKQQWGALPHQLYWHYWLPEGRAMPFINPENAKYRTLVRLWQRQPVFAANLIGPWIAKNLP